MPTMLVIAALTSFVSIAFASVWAVTLSAVVKLMRKTKKITLGAACIALGVLFMALGYFIEVLDLTVA